MTALHPETDTAMSEWAAFDRRHPDVTEHSIGGLAWGFMRAIAECPECPGVFRVPVNGKDWDTLGCRQCGGVWIWKDPEKAAAKPTRKKQKTRERGNDDN